MEPNIMFKNINMIIVNNIAPHSKEFFIEPCIGIILSEDDNRLADSRVVIPGEIP